MDKRWHKQIFENIFGPHDESINQKVEQNFGKLFSGEAHEYIMCTYLKALNEKHFPRSWLKKNESTVSSFTRPRPWFELQKLQPADEEVERWEENSIRPLDDEPLDEGVCTRTPVITTQFTLSKSNQPRDAFR